jgi:mono/diheme cytochrome c family protein
MRPLLAACAVLAACGSGQIVMPPPAPVEPPLPARLTLMPVTGTRPVSTEVMATSGAVGLSVVAGQVAIATLEGLSTHQGTSLVPVPVGPKGSGSVGTVRALSRRAGAALVLATGGVFQERQGRLLRSPMSDGLSLPTVRGLDVVGEGAAETWWLRTETAVQRATAAGVETLALQDPRGGGVVKAVVGRDASTALIVRGDRLYLIDVAAPSVVTLAKDLGAVSATARLATGVVLLATDAGLLRVSPSNEVTLLTLGAPGAVRDVVADGDAALVLANGAVSSLLVDELTVLGDVASPIAQGLVRDAQGALFVLDGAALKRLAGPTETPVTFADVRPFFAAHCTSCHTSGANYAPVFDLTNLQTARTWAQRSLSRVKNIDMPMPPASSGVLRPSQYAVLERWVAGGLLP